MSKSDVASREKWTKLVRDESITWLSSTMFATENKVLGHEVADTLLQSIVQGCEDLENDHFEDPDFGPRLSESGEDMRHKILDFHEEYNVKSKFADIKAKSDKRFDAVANDEYGENSIFIQNDKDENDDDEDSTINDEEGQRSDLEISIKLENERWREKLKAKPKEFWKWERATSEKSTNTAITYDGKCVCSLFSQSAMASGPTQGLLNDQWLMGALSLISTRAHMLMGIRNVHQSLIHFPSDPRVNINSRKYGVYVLRFYFNFKWHFILVDDRFLHIEEGNRKIMFGHCRDKSEMWVSLCEKGYAKACGAYEALNFGFVEEALQVLTGASISEMRLRYLQAMNKVGKGSQMLRDKSEKSFWKYLTTKIHTGDNVLGCSMFTNREELDVGDIKEKERETYGLIQGKPYIVLDGKEISGVSADDSSSRTSKERLLRLRNPWGPREWTCKWSDTSPETNKYKTILQNAFKQIPIEYKGITTQHVEPYAFDSTDSDFIMSINDWGKHFNCIFLASDRDEDIEKGKWFSQRKSGTVSGGYTDKFEVRIRKKTVSKDEATRQKMSCSERKEYATVEMTLWQEDMRLKDGYKSITARDTMSMVITEKGNDEKIIGADIPRTDPPCMQPPKHTGRIFLSTTQKMQTEHTYIIHANLTPSSALNSKISTSRRKARKMWIEVGSDAPFELVKQSSSRKSRAPKLETKSMQLLYAPMDKTKDIPTKETESNPIKQRWVKEKQKSRQATFINLKKLEQSGQELPAWMISLDDIRQDAEAREDEAYESKIKEESSSDDEEPNNGENVDERMTFWRSLRQEQWDSEPPPFDDTSGNTVMKDRSGEPPPPAFYADPNGIDMEAEIEARKAALLLQKISLNDYADSTDEKSQTNIPRSPYRSPKQTLQARDTVVYRGQLIMNVEYEKDSSYDSTVLVTVIEKLSPSYSMEFSITHPGENMTAMRSFTTPNIETILATKPVSLRRLDEDTDPKYVESEQAVQRWIDSGELPDHDDLVTWLIGRIKLNLIDGKLIIPSVDKSSKVPDDNDNVEDDDNDAVIQMTEEEDDSETDSDQSYGELYDALDGDENMAPESDEDSGEEEKDDDNDADYDFDFGEDEKQPEIKGKTAKEMIESAGVYLKSSDPFATASFAAQTELQKIKAAEKQRARIAKVREETIYRRARAKRAKEAYSKHMKHLQAKELGRAIMMQEMAKTIEEKAKRSVARDMRLKNAMRRQTNPYKHNGTKSLPGPVIGPGPISAAAVDNRGEIRRMRENSKYVFDMNGRRHLRKMMGKSYEGPPVERVIKKIQDIAKVETADWRLDFRKPFSQFDKNNDGKLSHDEFLDGISHMGVKMDEDEKAAVLNHFDTNNNGFIRYNEFVWAFYNKRKLISQWRLQKGPGKRSDATLLNSFFKYDIDGSRNLGRKEFKYALEDIGLKIEDWEMETLADKFDTDRDGLINPSEFLAFMHSLEGEEKKRREDAQKNARDMALSTNKTGKVTKTQERIEYEKLRIQVRAQEDEIVRLKKFVKQQERMWQRRNDASLIRKESKK